MPRGEKPGCLEDYWSGRSSCALCRGDSAVAFSALEENQVDHRLFQIESYDAAPGTDIFKAGDAAEAVFTLRRGFVKLWRRDQQGHCRIVRLLRTGDFVGLEALVEPSYSLSAATLSQSSLCRIPVSLLIRLEDENRNLYREIQHRWHSQLGRTDELLSTVISGSSRGRVIKLLRYLHAFAAPETCPRIRRLDMAAILDISSETAARVIAELKKAGLLQETSAELLFDPDQLPSGGEEAGKR